MISLNQIFVLIKGFIATLVIWCTDVALMKFAKLNFLNPNVRDFFIETKDVLNWIVTFVILITVLIKLKKENKK